MKRKKFGGLLFGHRSDSSSQAPVDADVVDSSIPGGDRCQGAIGILEGCLDELYTYCLLIYIFR